MSSSSSSSLANCRIAFIGGGNMASAIIGGLLDNGINKANVSVSAPSVGTREAHAARGVTVTPSNLQAASGADVIVIAVKPAVAKSVCEELAAARSQLAANPVFVSVAAGTTVDSLKKWLGGNVHVVRVMPNTPSLVGEGAAGVFAGDEVDETQRKLVNEILSSMCNAIEWVDKEDLLNVVTSVSGSGPAYFFAFVEHMTASAIAQGLPPAQAAKLAKQTCFGAGKMLVESPDEASELRRRVTSPNGTTHAALVSFEKLGLQDIVDKSMKACVARAEELGKAYS